MSFPPNDSLVKIATLNAALATTWPPLVKMLSVSKIDVLICTETLVKNVPKFAIVGGNPAKQFKSRNIEHYLDLKGKQLFN